MKHPTYGRLAAYARRCGIRVYDPLYAAQAREQEWHVEVRQSDNTISRFQPASMTPRPRMDRHAVATWFGILCMGAIAIGILAALR
jgi:hypothetical protein